MFISETYIDLLDEGKIKDHFKKHGGKYLAAAGALAVGAGGVALDVHGHKKSKEKMQADETVSKEQRDKFKDEKYGFGKRYYKQNLWTGSTKRY